MYEDFYREFEDKYRGSRELIKQRLEVYIPFVLPLHKVYPDSVAIDIGCGRGEWLELLGDNSISAKGVDIDSGMLDGAKDLDITLGDGIEYLSKEPSNSALVISAFHLVEHISFEDLMRLVSEANRVLVDGGVLILETPNPENIKVASETFYLDPTHTKPIPSELLSFVTKYHKFKRDKTLRLQEDKSIHNQLYVNVGHIIEGVSPDYSIVAQKEASNEILSILDEPFNREYGISPLMLVEKFEARLLDLENKLNIAHNSIMIQQQEIEQYSNLFIKRTLSISQQLRNLASVIENTSNDINIKMKVAQDKVDFILQYAKNIDEFAHHINKNFNNIKNSFTWRGLYIFERVARKIKREIGKSINTKKIKELKPDIKIEDSSIVEITKENIEVLIQTDNARKIYQRLSNET